jgi:hypothetical protein
MGVRGPRRAWRAPTSISKLHTIELRHGSFNELVVFFTRSNIACILKNSTVWLEKERRKIRKNVLEGNESTNKSQKRRRLDFKRGY